MENYSEKINVGSDEFPKMRDRLSISKIDYGYTLFDNKTRKHLLRRVEKEDAEKGRELLLASDEKGFNALVEEIKDKEVVVPKIIVFKEKHYDQHYYINTYEQLKRVSLKVLKDRMNRGYIFLWEVPEELEYTLEQIANLPSNLSLDAERQYNARRCKSNKPLKITTCTHQQ